MINNKILELFDTFKVVVYVPTNYVNTFLEKISERVVNQIGEYKNCISWTRVDSTWTSGENARPFIGTPGETSFEKEYRFEFSCSKENLEDVVKYINKIHPYETPEIDIIPIIMG